MRMCFQNACEHLLQCSSVSAAIGRQATWWRVRLLKCPFEPVTACMYVHGAAVAWLQAGGQSLALSLSLESE